MDQILKSAFLLGCALFIATLCWLASEIIKSSLLVDAITNPGTSIHKGITDAQSDFAQHHAHFRRVFTSDKGWSYPGILEDEAQGKYRDYATTRFWCGTRFHIDTLSLNFNKHQHNDNYAMAYNLELIKILDRNKNI